MLLIFCQIFWPPTTTNNACFVQSKQYFLHFTHKVACFLSYGNQVDFTVQSVIFLFWKDSICYIQCAAVHVWQQYGCNNVLSHDTSFIYSTNILHAHDEIELTNDRKYAQHLHVITSYGYLEAWAWYVVKLSSWDGHVFWCKNSHMTTWALTDWAMTLVESHIYLL